jgi:hypothetical protein
LRFVRGQVEQEWSRRLAVDQAKEVCVMAESDQPSPDELAEALDNVRTAIRDGEVPAVDVSLPIVMAEFDRLKAENAELKWNAAAAEDAEWD